jgi:hypothetical protein
MPAAYHAVHPNLWDPTFRRLSKDAKLVGFYIWTCPARTSEGLFQLNITHIAADVGLDLNATEEALAALEDAGFVSYDPDREIVLDRMALRTQPLRREGDNRVKSAVRIFSAIPDTPLRAEFLALARETSPALYQALINEYGDALPAMERSDNGRAPSHQEGASEGLRRGSEGASRASREEQRESEALEALPCIACGRLSKLRDPDSGEPIHAGCAEAQRAAI